MKGTYLGEFQELVMLSILVLEDNAYGVTIQEEINVRVKRNISRGALHAALKRLLEKGFIQSSMGGATAERGGRRKKYYTLTDVGREAVTNVRDLRNSMWNAISSLSIQGNGFA